MSKKPDKNICLLILLSILLCLNIKGQDSTYVLDPFGMKADNIWATISKGSHFTTKKDFYRFQFDSTSNFRRAKFDSITSFYSSVFVSNIDFSESKFYSQVNFYGTQFRSSSDFSFAEFHSKVDFINSEFRYDVTFENTKFDSLADFGAVQFGSSTDFSNSDFKSSVNFGSPLTGYSYVVGITRFKHFADFSGARFNGDVGFGWTTLPESLDFRFVTHINKEIDFTVASYFPLGIKCRIALTGSDISKIKINYELFQLWFPQETSYEDKISTYEKLLKKFSDDGFLESYKLLDIEYRNFKNIADGNVALNRFLKYWWNYGYNKEWVLWWSLGFLFFFTLINSFFLNHLRSKVYEVKFAFYDENDFEKASDKFRLKNSARLLSGRQVLLVPISVFLFLSNFVAFYFINSLIYTSVLFFGLRIDLERFKKFSPLTLYVWTIYIVGLFCLAYILNIIIVK